MKQIGWQKYEDVLEQQLQSPLLQSFYDSFNSFDEEDFTEEELRSMQEIEQPQQVISVDSKLMESVTLTSNFDCWMGHTNFNITDNIKRSLIELMVSKCLKSVVDTGFLWVSAKCLIFQMFVKILRTHCP